MEINVTIKYFRAYIPQGKRKARYNDVTEIVPITIKETTKDNLQLAFSIDYADKYDIFFYKNKLYKKTNETISDLVDCAVNSSTFYARVKDYHKDIFDPINQENRVDLLLRVENYYKDYLIVDNDVYRTCFYPMYQVCTFGLGGNHGGTALMPTDKVQLHKQTIRDCEYFFSPYDFDKALAFAKEVALRRLDTESVQFFRQCIITHIPELIKKY